MALESRPDLSREAGVQLLGKLGVQGSGQELGQAVEEVEGHALAWQLPAQGPRRRPTWWWQRWGWELHRLAFGAFVGPLLLTVDPLPALLAGRQITITGSGFTAGMVEVVFNGVMVAVTVIDDNTLQVTDRHGGGHSHPQPVGSDRRALQLQTGLAGQEFKAGRWGKAICPNVAPQGFSREESPGAGARSPVPGNYGGEGPACKPNNPVGTARGAHRGEKDKLDPPGPQLWRGRSLIKGLKALRP